MTATPKRKPAAAAERAIQFKVQLRYIRPPIWRRVVLPDNATLGDLHRVIQRTMGWDGFHLHSFRIGNVYYTDADALAMGGMDMDDEDRLSLADVVSRAKQKFMYEYDFGDSWEHEIVAEKFLPFDPAAKYPVCIGGARACPPEDCGGFPGYMGVLEALGAEKPTREQKGLLEWLGEEYDPEDFDLEATNRKLG